MNLSSRSSLRSRLPWVTRRRQLSAPRIFSINCLHSLAFVAPICFDAACAAEADRTFIGAIGLPLIVLIAALGYLLRPVPKELEDEGKVFTDKATGIVFGGAEGVPPERDEKGELTFRVISYTPWPVQPDYEGERLRIDVGPVLNREPRTYVFPKLLAQPSILVQVTLPRPLGIVLEYHEDKKQTFVSELIEGSNAQQRSKIAALNKQQEANAVLPGDLLRAVTCTNFVYSTKALYGAVPPERHIVVYSADKMKFSEICNAMRKGNIKDGPVTLILERKQIPSSSLSTNV